MPISNSFMYVVDTLRTTNRHIPFGSVKDLVKAYRKGVIKDYHIVSDFSKIEAVKPITVYQFIESIAKPK